MLWSFMVNTTQAVLSLPATLRELIMLEHLCKLSLVHVPQAPYMLPRAAAMPKSTQPLSGPEKTRSHFWGVRSPIGFTPVAPLSLSTSTHTSSPPRWPSFCLSNRPIRKIKRQTSEKKEVKESSYTAHEKMCLFRRLQMPGSWELHFPSGSHCND